MAKKDPITNGPGNANTGVGTGSSGAASGQTNATTGAFGNERTPTDNGLGQATDRDLSHGDIVDSDPRPVRPDNHTPISSPFIPANVQGNFFNLGQQQRGYGGMRQGAFFPTADIVRMLEQIRMQKMNELFYAPFLSAFGRRF